MDLHWVNYALSLGQSSLVLTLRYKVAYFPEKVTHFSQGQVDLRLHRTLTYIEIPRSRKSKGIKIAYSHIWRALPVSWNGPPLSFPSIATTPHFIYLFQQPSSNFATPPWDLASVRKISSEIAAGILPSGIPQASSHLSFDDCFWVPSWTNSSFQLPLKSFPSPFREARRRDEWL